MSLHPPAVPFGDIDRAGVYQLPQASTADLRSAAEAHGLTLFSIDLEGINTKDGFLAAIGQALRFPDWFGRNWDALEDCLTDMSWQPAGGYVVILAHADGLCAADEQSFVSALRILQATAEFWREDAVPFWTLVELQPLDGNVSLPELS